MSPVRRRLLSASLLGGVAMLTAGATAAAEVRALPDTAPIATQDDSAPRPQNTPPQTQTTPTEALSTARVEEARGRTEVVVTGSRIRRTDLTSAEPIAVIGASYLTERNFTNVAEVLNQLPGVAGSVAPNGDQGSFGTGRNFVNLFNIGSQRTLTLVNSRRFISDNAVTNFSGINSGGQVDLNQIPTAFLDRIETVFGDGSTIYGSDAVSGVVNIITKSRFTGVDVDGQYGISQLDDYPTYRGRIAVGRDFLDHRLNLAVTGEYVETGSLVSTDRNRTAQAYTFATNPSNRTATDGIPATILIAGRTVPETNPNGIPFRINSSTLSNIVQQAGVGPVQFAPDGTLVPYATGQFYSASVASGGQGLSLVPLTSLETPNKRYLAAGIGTFDITPHMHLHTEVNFSRVESTEPANQPIYNSAIFGAPSGNLPFSINNPFLTAQARSVLAAGGLTNGTFYLSRASTDIVGSSSVNANTDSYRAVLDFSGDFNAIGQNFTYQAYYNQGQTSGGFVAPGINQQKFLNAINATRDASGNIVCAAPTTAAAQAAFAGCAPLNLFGFGAPSAAALAYVTTPFESDFLNQQDDAEFNFTGALVDLPGGKLSFALGYEYRREQAKFKPDDNSRAGVGRSVPIAGAKGAFDTNEAYGELSIPIFGPNFNFLGMRSLTFDVSDRQVNNSLAGFGRAYSYGAKWYPVKDLLIRATRSRSFRSPSITELFLPQSTAFSTATDPCDMRSINSGPNPVTRQANCAKDFVALGLPANFPLTSTVQDRTSMIITGGNPTLHNEIAEQYTYGFTYQPRVIPNLAITADLINIQISGAISNLTLTSILSTCYDSPSHPADVCSRFQRSSTGQILDNALTGYVNAGFANYQFLQATFEYNFEPHNIPTLENVPGRIGLVLRALHNDRYETSVSGTGFDIVRSAGTIGLPRWRGNLDVSYANGPFNALITTQYQSAVFFNNTFTVESQQFLRLRDYFVTSINAEYKLKGWGGRYSLRAGINNLFDVEPPFPTTNSTNYDLIGRYFNVGVNARF